ncbi:hypothetical protein ACFFMN_26625 [Planobispora siamensis]|uniref:Uncharacterized protein n=1 Tax=Planobispora siamensis TaxID=936338 RepID=A0A8J3SDX9_9ACTN|nr:hypothetical protein [Planobispora siamensis]GIH90760.1 hypothetical protein Psi01_13900 [Planobispora siamensis]
MRDRADFERYVEQRSGRLLRTAYLLCRDRDTAEKSRADLGFQIIMMRAEPCESGPDCRFLAEPWSYGEGPQPAPDPDAEVSRSGGD